MRTFTTLIQNVRSCSLCADHLPAGVRPVLQAHPDARVLIAGQAPGRKVHATGIPFDDPSGNRLRQWLGVSSEEFYDHTQIAILPMGFCYPGSARSGDLPPRPECAPAWRSSLLNALPKIQLTVVLGAYALKYHLPDSKGSLTQIVQCWEDYWPHTVPLPHPSPRNMAWFKRNSWFESEVIPTLQQRVRSLLSD